MYDDGQELNVMPLFPCREVALDVGRKRKRDRAPGATRTTTFVPARTATIEVMPLRAYTNDTGPAWMLSDRHGMPLRSEKFWEEQILGGFAHQ